MNRINDYSFAKLYSISSGISTTKDQAGNGSPFVSFGTVFNNYFLPDELPDLMSTSAREQEAYSIKEGDIFLTRTSETLGELAMSCVALKDYPKATFSGFTKRLRPKTEGIAYHKYLGFYLRGYLFRQAIKNHSIMTLRSSFNEEIFALLKLYLPEYGQQVQIGDFLYSIEQKIQLNNRINAELEEAAKLLYDYWFVQFDFPDAEGNPYYASGGKMVYSELLNREIPNDWCVSRVEELLAPVAKTRKLQTNEYCNVGKTPIIDQSQGYIVGFTDVQDAILENVDEAIIFGDHTRVLKYINFKFARGADGTQVIISNTNRMPQLLFYFTLLKFNLSNYGYSRHFKFLKEQYVTIPSFEIATRFNSIVTPWYQLITRNRFENFELTTLRDFLLPFLMNGQVTIM